MVILSVNLSVPDEIPWFRAPAVASLIPDQIPADPPAFQPPALILSRAGRAAILDASGVSGVGRTERGA